MALGTAEVTIGRVVVVGAAVAGAAIIAESGRAKAAPTTANRAIREDMHYPIVDNKNRRQTPWPFGLIRCRATSGMAERDTDEFRGRAFRFPHHAGSTVTVQMR